MKKVLVSIALIIGLTLLLPTTALAVSCGGFGTHGECGTTGGCTSEKEICIAGWLGYGTCEKTDAGTSYAGQCDNRTSGTQGAVCGYTSFTDQYCGSNGGCAQGYMCDSGSKVCVKQTACENMSVDYGKQCGNFMSGTVGECGSIGACAQGYRCTADTSSPFGYSCQQTADQNGIKCDGSTVPTTPTTPTAPVGNTGVGTTTPPTNNTGVGDPTAPNTPPKSTFDIFAGPTSKDFASLDPLRQDFADSNVTNAYFTSPAGIISRVLLFAFPIAGLILFVMLVWSGFQIIMGGAQGSKSIEAGRQRATTAIIGFILLFVAYWVMQIIEIIFSIQIL